MIRNFELAEDHKLLETENFQDFSYIFQPSKEEIGQLVEHYNFPFDYLSGILDDYENARFEEDRHGNILLLLQFAALSENEEVQTFPYAIVTTTEHKIILAMNHQVELLDIFEGRYEDKRMGHQLIYHIISKLTEEFYGYLGDIHKRRSEIGKSIRESTKNDQLLELIHMQASLVYIEEALENNLSVIKKYMEKLKEIGEDGFAERMFDLYIETEQAKKEARIQSKLIENLRDLFSNIVANNLNIVMKIMTSATFVLGIPAVIFGFYGINVPIPGQAGKWVVWIIIGMTLLICALVSWILRKKNMM